MPPDIDADFREAIGTIDAGDEDALRRCLDDKPHLVQVRLEPPGMWLRSVVGKSVEPGGFFERPYLLWFVAEDPVRNGELPLNIAAVASQIIAAARRESPESVQEQIDYALRLVSWSWIARQCGVQIGLIDVLVDAGASIDGRDLYGGRYGSHCDAAIYNGNMGAAEHLVRRGATLTLTAAACLNRWDDLERLAASATSKERDDAFVQAAMRGNGEALRRMLALGFHANATSDSNQSHATALHHAVWSGNLDAVRVLVEAGADLNRRDALHGGTALDWAEYGRREEKDEARVEKYRKIAEYLRGWSGL